MRGWPPRRSSPIWTLDPQRLGKAPGATLLLAAHRSVVGERSRLYNQLQALLIGAPAALRERVGPTRNGATLAERISGMRTRPTASMQENTTLQVLRDIANRTRALDQQAKSYTSQIQTLADELAPGLLDEPGIGPICAGKLIAFNPTRFKSEAAFARANGTAPQPASSGKPSATASAAPATAKSTRRSTRSRSPARSTTPQAAPTCNAESTRERPNRGHAIPQATPLPPPLQAARKHALDNIEASNDLHSVRTPHAHPCISSVLAVGAAGQGRDVEVGPGLARPRDFLRCRSRCEVVDVASTASDAESERMGRADLIGRLYGPVVGVRNWPLAFCQVWCWQGCSSVLLARLLGAAGCARCWLLGAVRWHAVA